VCPNRYRTRHFFNNSNTNEDIATKFEQKYVCCVRNEKKSSVNEEPLHSEKNGVWCGMSRQRIIGPIFFDATITTAAYMEISNTFVNQLGDEELSVGYFQQDGATSHTSHASMAEIQSFFRLPRHFEGTLATALARSDTTWLFLMGIYKREILPKQTTNHRRLESKHHLRNSGSYGGHTGKDFPKCGVPGSILSGRKWWPLPAHVMTSSHFLHNEVCPLEISLQYPH